LIKAALAVGQDECIYLSLDTSMFWDEYCLVRLVVVHRGRAKKRELASDEASECNGSIQRLSGDAPTIDTPFTQRG